jgi:hypothetical protein
MHRLTLLMHRLALLMHRLALLMHRLTLLRRKSALAELTEGMAQKIAYQERSPKAQFIKERSPVSLCFFSSVLLVIF